MLKKYMSHLGIGSAKIDLILQKETFKPGDPIHGYFLIKGGTVEQKLKRIDCDLIMSDRTAHVEKVIDETTILTSTHIHSKEFYKVPFTFRVPDSVPLSTEEVSFYFKTRLNFDKGVESRDHDIIRIIQ